MRISLIIILSLAVNFTLGALLFKQSLGRTAAEPGSEEAEISPVGSAPAADETTPVPVENSGATPAGRVSWRDLQLPDLKEFIRKLRAVHCPEGTIQDLVLAEVNRRFMVKQSAIWKDMWADQLDFWKPYQRKPDPEKAKQSREKSRQMRVAQKEKTALIVELFGFDVEKQRMKEEGYDPENMGWNSGNLAYLPEAKRDSVQTYLDNFQDKEQEFYASVQGGWDADARARQKQLEQEKLAGLAQILTPSELREYELRSSQMASQVQSEIHGVDLTRTQYEALYDVRSKYGDSIYNWSDEGNDPAGAAYKQIEQNKKDLQADIATTLGPDKAQELERAQDYSYQQLNSLARHNDLPADTASKVYDFKSAAEKAAQDLRANTDLTPEQRQAALAQIRTETEQAVKGAFGSDKIYKRYQNNGGWWLNNIAPANQ